MATASSIASNGLPYFSKRNTALDVSDARSKNEAAIKNMISRMLSIGVDSGWRCYVSWGRAEQC